MKLARRPESDQPDAAVGKPGGDIPALVGVQTQLDAMLVLGAQLDAREASLAAMVNERWQVPLRAPHVGHKSELHETLQEEWRRNS